MQVNYMSLLSADGRIL